jgi:hypothetical protein
MSSSAAGGRIVGVLDLETLTTPQRAPRPHAERISSLSRIAIRNRGHFVAALAGARTPPADLPTPRRTGRHRLVARMGCLNRRAPRLAPTRRKQLRSSHERSPRPQPHPARKNVLRVDGEPLPLDAAHAYEVQLRH